LWVSDQFPLPNNNIRMDREAFEIGSLTEANASRNVVFPT
jgi:hypothetical protein